MKQFLLLTLIVFTAFISHAQSYGTVFKTKVSGNYDQKGTWVGNSVPPYSGQCDCTIEVASNTTLTITRPGQVQSGGANISLENAVILLHPNSTLSFGDGRNLVLTGASAVDIHPGATISKTNLSTSNITLKGTVIYTSAATKYNSTIAGTVSGPASASSLRSDPNFSSGTLPVKLTAFRVKSGAGIVELSWTTDQEINSDYFDIQRSVDGSRWTALAKVAAAGNSGSTRHYLFSDKKPAAGQGFYRLKMVDIDQRFEYSPIRVVGMQASANQLIAGPNPASGVLNISLADNEGKEFRLKVISMGGQVMFNRMYSSGSRIISIPVSAYPEGTYFVELAQSNGFKLLKQILIARK